MNLFLELVIVLIVIFLINKRLASHWVANVYSSFPYHWKSEDEIKQALKTERINDSFVMIMIPQSKPAWKHEFLDIVFLRKVPFARKIELRHVLAIWMRIEMIKMRIVKAVSLMELIKAVADELSRIEGGEKKISTKLQISIDRQMSEETDIVINYYEWKRNVGSIRERKKEFFSLLNLHTLEI